MRIEFACASRRPAGPSTGLRCRQHGFTMIEVMVVVVILSILATFVVPNIVGNTDRARVTKVKQDIRAIEQALDLYRLDNYAYPTTDQGLEALVNEPTTPPEPRNWQPYLKKLPMDPWNNEYQYLNPGQFGAVDVFSLGSDGQAGGEGTAADLGNWNLDQQG